MPARAPPPRRARCAELVRIAITGATGNVGTSVVGALGADPTTVDILGIARRSPDWTPPKTTWLSLDITTADLRPVFEGVDAVIHLAWLIQPSRDQRAMWATNVVGTRRVLEAVSQAGVERLITVSSIGAYSPAPPGRVVDESWPTDGVPESTYSWQKAIQEHTLVSFADSNPQCRSVVLRPALIFKREAAREIRNLFIGHLLPQHLLPVAPVLRLLRRSPLPFQCVHTDDVADAIRRCLVTDAVGAFNLAAEGVIGSLKSDRDRWSARVSPFVAAAWRARLVPVDPGWIRLAASVPVLSTGRAAAELGWHPTRPAIDVLSELLDGLRADAHFQTPPLAARRLWKHATRCPASSDTDTAVSRVGDLHPLVGNRPEQLGLPGRGLR
jgi:UDP-glucose 4-epimerase